MKNLTFRAYRQPAKSKDKDQPQQDGAADPQQSSYLKRREQVRKAQRTHRERKEAYIKSLESEVLQLRTNETKIMQETMGLYKEIGRLQKLLAQNGIEASPSQYVQTALSSSGDEVPTTTVLSVRRNRKLDQIHVGGSDSQTGAEDFFLSGDSSSAPNSRWKNFFGKKQSQASDGGSSQGQPSNPATSPNAGLEEAPVGSIAVAQMDLANVGMEFVLTLESPCLHHTQGNPKEPHAPSGHALTVSAPLLFQAPSASALQLPSSSWEAPHLGLERLLELSSNIELGDDEMTPVQAWNYVRNHDAFAQIDVQLLRKLTQDLLGAVKCYGFGATIEQTTLENLVFDSFVVGRVF
ncbi:hypothetical protein BU16DRAFT_524164 [Lophium mytilinum]|uniref:BZIP domain-containing protein n=1 Tax=Lophium mytilinum TaxID=390894 RepID=A0A6A6R577_9PEZI|nr:hypothetical protein BU16DRAFT_524164 [Lophium mytilinum]